MKQSSPSPKNGSVRSRSSPKLNDHLYEGRYTPTNAQGKREPHNVYAQTYEECEQKLNAMIEEVKARIKAEKELNKPATQ